MCECGGGRDGGGDVCSVRMVVSWRIGEGEFEGGVPCCSELV